MPQPKKTPKSPLKSPADDTGNVYLVRDKDHGDGKPIVWGTNLSLETANKVKEIVAAHKLSKTVRVEPQTTSSPYLGLPTDPRSPAHVPTAPDPVIESAQDLAKAAVAPLVAAANARVAAPPKVVIPPAALVPPPAMPELPADLEDLEGVDVDAILANGTEHVELAIATSDMYHYNVLKSPDDPKDWIGVVQEFPSLSWIDGTQSAALFGIKELVRDTLVDMFASGETPPAPVKEEGHA